MSSMRTPTHYRRYSPGAKSTPVNLSCPPSLSTRIGMRAEKKSEAAKSLQLGRRRFLQRACLGLLALIMPRPLLAMVDHQQNHTETIAVLQAIYNGEMLAQQRYLAYAQKALAENHPNIAYLFRALATSEAIHARNFKAILAGLDIRAEKSDTPPIKVGSTRENLKFASEVELAEIDTQYPNFLKRISQENHKEASEKITFAWEAEKQHRELIKKILSGTGIFFGILTEKFRSTPVRYFVCQNCGATLTELPEEACPVCDLPVDIYEEIKKPA